MSSITPMATKLTAPSSRGAAPPPTQPSPYGGVGGGRGNYLIPDDPAAVNPSRQVQKNQLLGGGGGGGGGNLLAAASAGDDHLHHHHQGQLGNKPMMMMHQLQDPQQRRGIFLTSDDHSLARQIEVEHTPDGREYDVRPLFHLVEEIIKHATQTVEAPLLGNVSQREMMEKKYALSGGLGEAIESPLIIERISCEMKCNLLGGSDAHSATISVLRLLAHYTWEAKVVLTLAAFALTYGDFWLLVQIYTTNPLAKPMAEIKRLPSVVEHVGSFKPQLEAVNELIRAMLEVTRCIVEFGELPTNYISDEDPDVKAAMGYFPIAVYWIIRSAVSAATQITTLSSMRFEYMNMTANTEAWELSNWSHKLNTIKEHLRKTLSNLYRLIEEKRLIDSINRIDKIINSTIHVDNMIVLETLIGRATDDGPPLYDGSTKRRVELHVLRSKHVLLLISGLDITHDEIFILEQSYSESKMHAYEIVWLPIVDRSTNWTNAMQVQFETLQASMPWYTVHHPSIVQDAVIKFIRDEWHFGEKPILVVLDPRGKILNHNAIHMMWIWQSNAFPFTRTREEDLWEKETWSLELLVDGIDPTITNWIREGKSVFVYGGDDMDWIRKFTTQVRATSTDLRVPIEMVYVGRSHNKQAVQRICANIALENLGPCWQEPTMVWFFWTRLESMIYSKFQMGRVGDYGDIILQEIQRLHSYDKGHSGWAVLAQGSSILVTGHGGKSVTALEQREQWKGKGFPVGYVEHYNELHMKEWPCYRCQFPSTMKIPKVMFCPECRRPMRKHTSFICCHEDVVPETEGVPPAVLYEA